jgi:hypothetical protein
LKKCPIIDEAKDAVRVILRCCLASNSASHLSSEESAMLRAELVRLGEVLEAQIGEIIDIRLTQLAGVAPSATRH